MPAGLCRSLPLRTEQQTLLSLISSSTEESENKIPRNCEETEKLPFGWLLQLSRVTHSSMPDSQGQVMNMSLVDLPAISLIDSSFTPAYLFHTTQYVAQQ